MNLKKFLRTKSEWSANHIPVFIAYILVWGFAGIWHGGDSKAMIGTCLIPCIYLIFTDIVHDYTQKLYDKYKSLQDNIIYRIIQMIFIYILLCFSWIFIMIQTSGKDIYLILLKSLHNIKFDLSIKIIEQKDLYIIITGFIIILIIDIIKENKINIKNIYVKNIPIIVHWFILTVLLVIILLFGFYGPNYSPKDFVYFKF